MIFKSINLTQWQQFYQVDLTFHDQVTIITGANGSGKTTLLRLLARHFGWEFYQLRTPYKHSKRGFLYRVRALFGLNTDYEPENKPIEIGKIEYSSGRKSPIRVPAGDTQASYLPTIDTPEQVSGFFIPSHRPDFRYQRVENLPLRARPWDKDAFEIVHDSIRSSSQGGGGASTIFRMKEILIGLAVFGYGSEVVVPDQIARSLYEGFQNILLKVLPEDIGFKSISIRDRTEVVFETTSGDFLLDAVSGGAAAIIELAWEIFMYSKTKEGEYIVVIDEPENHLHGSMQRSLLPRFVAAFPNAQFIVATHSPLIVSSMKDSNVYALRFGINRNVTSELLDIQSKAGTADEILREILDVSITMPIWAEEALQSIITKYVTRSLTTESARDLRKELTNAGLSRWIPDAIVRLANQQEIT